MAKKFYDKSINGLIIRNHSIIFKGKTSYNSKGKEWQPRYVVRCLDCFKETEIMLSTIDLRTVKKCICTKVDTNKNQKEK